MLSTTRSGTRQRSARLDVAWGVAVAAVVLVVAVLVGLYSGAFFSRSAPRMPNSHGWTNGSCTFRTRSGNAGEQKPIFLERLPLRLTIELPVGSKAGAYELQLKMNDRTVVSTAGMPKCNGTTAFVARINLSKLDPGSYSMVIRQVPHDWNLYPVVLR